MNRIVAAVMAVCVVALVVASAIEGRIPMDFWVIAKFVTLGTLAALAVYCTVEEIEEWGKKE